MAYTSRFKRHSVYASEKETNTRLISDKEINFEVATGQEGQSLQSNNPQLTRPKNKIYKSQLGNQNHRFAHNITTIAAVFLALLSLALAVVVVTVLPSQNARIRAQQKIIQKIESEKNSLIEQIDKTKQTLALVTTFNSALHIRTEPPGARVLLSGNEIGTTPLQAEGLAAGPHKIRLLLEGYETVEFETNLPEKDMVDFGTFSLQRSCADLTLTAINPGTGYALFSADGQKISDGILPAFLNDLPTGRYRLALRWGVHEGEQIVEVHPGKTNNYAVGFQTAFITLNSTPPGATVELNGVALGRTPLTSLEVPAGTAQLTLRSKGHLEETLEVTLQPGTHQNLTLALKPHPGPPQGKNFTNSAGMEMIWHPLGFWVARHEVTQQAFQKITGTNPSTFRGSNMPVETLTWSAAADFARRLTTYEKENDMLPLGYRYALPTEQQWNTFAGNTPRANAGGESADAPRPVGGDTNAYGLDNIHDNVWEWSADTPPGEPLKRVVLGGGWSAFYSGLDAQRTRTVQPRDFASPAIGMRVVLIPQ
jgi:hypothetical protein